MSETISKPKENTLLNPAPINITASFLPKNTSIDETKTEKREETMENKKEEKINEKKEETKNETITNQPLLNEDNNVEVDDNFYNRLMNALHKVGVLRPTALFDGADIDITKTDKEREKIQKDKIANDANEEQKIKEQDLKELEKIKKQDSKRNYNKSEEIALNNNNYLTLDNDLAKFTKCKKVYIDQYYKISDMFVICPLYYNYRISLEYEKEGEAYYLFDSKDLSSTCSHNCCPNQAKSVKMEIGSYGIGKGIRQRFAIFEKPYRCACLFLCACCTRPTFNIFINEGNEKIGYIREIRTACDPTLNVFSKYDTLKYTISGSCCQCGYCCKDLCCGMCNSATFSIYNGADDKKEKPEGTISKIKFSGNKVKPDYEQSTIVYPIQASCEDKVLILAAALFIQILYFQNINNTKRCNGNPLD